MTDAAIVAVRGEATAEVDPELGGFTVTVSARDRDRATTLTRVVTRHNDVRSLLEEYAEAIERQQTSLVNVHPEDKRRGERVTAYVGSISTTVMMTDFDLMGEVMLRLSDSEQTAVIGPWWSLRPTSPVYQEARKTAIGEAIERAREYAAVLGSEVTRLIELSDEGLGGEQAPQPRLFGTRSAGVPRSSGEPQLNLDPQKQIVRARVEARFAISDPTAL